MEGDYAVAPFTAIIDTREQTPWIFKDIIAERWVVRTKNKERIRRKIELPLVVPINNATLQTGDYSIAGYESEFTLERKSLGDALGTFTQGRERFERELERMAEFKFAAVVMEFSEQRMQHDLPPDRKIGWKTLDESIRAWRQRYGVHFIWCKNRFFAELSCVREMRRWWNDTHPEAEIKWGVQEPLSESVPGEPEEPSMWGSARHIDEWDEEVGSVLWWTNPIVEPPYSGTPYSSDWPGYHEWWTELFIPPNLK